MSSPAAGAAAGAAGLRLVPDRLFPLPSCFFTRFFPPRFAFRFYIVDIQLVQDTARQLIFVSICALDRLEG